MDKSVSLDGWCMDEVPGLWSLMETLAVMLNLLVLKHHIHNVLMQLWLQEYSTKG